MADEVALHELSFLLTALAANPGKRDSLHAMLGPYCHQGRNHLNSLKLSLYLAKVSTTPNGCDLWTNLESRYQELELLFDHLQLIYRPLRLTPVRLPLSLLFEDARECWTERLARAGRGLVLEPPGESAVGDFDPLQLRVGLDAFVDWRQPCGQAGGEVALRWGVADGHFVVEWLETEEVTPATQQPGNEPDGLALPVLARVIAAHRGTLAVTNHHGFHLTMRWPLEIDRCCLSP